MATGLIKKNSVIGIEEEVTEGTYLAPTAATSYMQPLEDGFSIAPARELLDRAILNASPGKPTPRLGIKSVTAELPVEYRASGIEGGAPDFDSLLKSALGAVRSATTSTSKTGNSATQIEIEDADISKYAVGDIVLVKEAGAWEMRPISAVDPSGGAANIQFPFALENGAPSDNVVIGAFRTYLTAATGHVPLSLSYYWADEIRQALSGGKVTSMSIDNFTTGQIGSFNFSVEGLSYEDEVDGSAGFTPVYDSALPPILLKACVYYDGVVKEVNTVSLSLSNTLGFITDLCSPNGRVSSRVTDREITGSINPYKDDTTTEFFDDWNDGTEFSLFVSAFNPSAVAGEFDPGSIVSLWLPQCINTEFNTEDLEGILVDALTFRATRGANGDQEELYIGMI